VVEDLLVASEIDADVVWNMTTKARNGYSYDPETGVITLVGMNAKGEQKIIRLKIIFENASATPDGIAVNYMPVSDYLHPYETPADDYRFLRINYKVKAGATQRMKVYVLPEDVSLSTSTFNIINI
jgi:hypothetical protein